MLCKLFSQCYAESMDKCLKNNQGCLDFKGYRSILKCEENGKSYKLDTQGAKVAQYHVDGGLINDKIKKCDYMVVAYGNENKIIFVELKGNDTNHACEQLKATVDLLSNKFTSFDKKKFYARIVNTKSVPNIKTTTHYQKLRKTINLLNPKSGDYIKISSRTLNESLDELN